MYLNLDRGALIQLELTNMQKHSILCKTVLKDAVCHFFKRIDWRMCSAAMHRKNFLFIAARYIVNQGLHVLILPQGR